MPTINARKTRKPAATKADDKPAEAAAPATEAKADNLPATTAPATEAKADDKPAAPRHDTPTSYTGASPLTRARKKAARVMLNRVCGSRTDRDEAFAKALRDKHGTDAFPAANYDAGAISRLIAHGDCEHVAGTGHADGGYIADGDFRMLKR